MTIIEPCTSSLFLIALKMGCDHENQLCVLEKKLGKTLKKEGEISNTHTHVPLNVLKLRESLSLVDFHFF
jgi:hypothetical protein